MAFTLEWSHRPPLLFFSSSFSVLFFISSFTVSSMDFLLNLLFSCSNFFFLVICLLPLSCFLFLSLTVDAASCFFLFHSISTLYFWRRQKYPLFLFFFTHLMIFSSTLSVVETVSSSFLGCFIAVLRVVSVSLAIRLLLITNRKEEMRGWKRAILSITIFSSSPLMIILFSGDENLFFSPSFFV